MSSPADLLASTPSAKGTLARWVVVVILALLGAVLVGAGAVITSGVTLAATTALIMGGTSQPDPAAIPPYMQNVETYYIDPTTSCKVATCRLVAVVTPEQLWPVPGWGTTTFDSSVAQGVVDLNTALSSQLAAQPDGSVVLFGYSQSADIVTIEKRNLATASPAVKRRLSLVVIGDTNRPNGGILERFAGLSVPVIDFTFDGAMPTDTGITTTDIAFQYDIAADFPRYPIDILADLNSLAGWGIHGTYPTTLDGYTPEQLQQAINDPNNRQVYGDTTYITIPALHLPLLQPLRDLGVATGTSALVTPIADLIEPTLRVLVELGYDRSIPYGQPAPLGLFPPINPIQLAGELIAAAVQGVNAARADITGTPTPAPARTGPATPAGVPQAPVVTSLLTPALITQNVITQNVITQNVVTHNVVTHKVPAQNGPTPPLVAPTVVAPTGLTTPTFTATTNPGLRAPSAINLPPHKVTAPNGGGTSKHSGSR